MSNNIENMTKIVDFPQPFKPDYTPYPQTNFDVRNDCKNSIAKVIILGDLSVGKTCIVARYCHQEFSSNYKATIGVDFEIETFEILDSKFTLQVWDTAGQERFRSIAQSYYKGAHAIVIVFDLKLISTLINTTIWLNDALAANNDGPLIFLVGNKKDLLSPAAYQNMETCAGEIAMKMKAEYWAVSAKIGENIDNLFMRIAALLYGKMAEQNNNSERPIRIGDDTTFRRRNGRKRKKCGCL